MFLNYKNEILNYKEKILNFHITKENFPKVVLFLWLLNEFFLTICRFFLHRLKINGTPREIVLFVVSSIPLILLIRLYKKDKSVFKDCKLFFIIYTLSILSFLIGYILHPEYDYFFFRKDYGLLRVFRPDSAIYALLFFSLVDKAKDFYNIIKYFSYFNFINILILVYIPRLIRGYWIDVNYLGEKVHRYYSVSFGYTLIFPTIVFMYLYYRERKIRDLVLSLICTGIVFFQGSRGAIFLPILFIIFMSISNAIHYDSKKKILTKVIIVFVTIGLIFVFRNEIKNLIAYVFKSLGLKSRLITKMLTTGITDGTGRKEIWDLVVGAIKNNWFFGYGAYGDRPFVFPEHFVAYSHNIVLEMICSFGIFGVGICLFLLIKTIQMFLCKDRTWRELYIVFFTISCQLLLSLSFWYVAEFWIMIAILYKYHQVSKRQGKGQTLEEM